LTDCEDLDNRHPDREHILSFYGSFNFPDRRGPFAIVLGVSSKYSSTEDISNNRAPDAGPDPDQFRSVISL
jgi:hypothetical protein